MIQLIQITLGRSLVDCPTQLALIFILWYLYLSVFHDKCQSYKYEKIQQGNLLEGPSLYGWPNLEYGIWLKRNITSSSPQQWQMFCNDSCVISCFQTECLSYSWIIFSLFFLSKHQCSRRAGSHMGSISVLVKSLQQCTNLKKKKKIFMARQVTRPSCELGNLTRLVSDQYTQNSKQQNYPPPNLFRFLL